MNSWSKYGIPAGIIIAAVIAIYFYGRSQYDKGKSDLRTELLLQKPKIDTVIKHDTVPILGESKGRPIFDRKWTRLKIDSVGADDMIVIHTDSCEDLKIPYVVEVRDKEVYGEIICKPESQSAKWDLKVIKDESQISSTKYIPQEYSFWFTPIGGYNKDGVLVGGMIGFKSIGIGVLQQEKPIWLVGLHFDF